MAINLFANVLNNDAIDNLTPAQADAVLAIFNKPKSDAPDDKPSPFVAEHFAIIHVTGNNNDQEV